ncbi:MAG: amino acid ABC transporter permease [Hyphomicrobiales bacterium]|nr:MAG: amino acid ABC transporter permease [Hyphomicrobiales bacterium]
MNSKPNIAFVRDHMDAAMPPPSSEVGALGWMRRNLFSSVSNTILTLLVVYVAYLIIPGSLEWSIFNAVWEGTDRLACATTQQGGELPVGWHAACWPYVIAYSKLFIYGRYPDPELWRVNLVLVMFFAGLVPLLMPSVGGKRVNLIFMLGIFPVLALVLLSGGNFEFGQSFWEKYAIFSLAVLVAVFLYMRATENSAMGAVKSTAIGLAIFAAVILFISADFGLVSIETPLWGGFVMTLVIAVTGIVVSLPLGIILALGRRSQMPAVRLFSVIFIEFWRGVPLITVLFMSSVMLPLFLPDGVSFDKLLRALIGVALFSTAYMAEVIRGGMQAIPKGQYEGAMAVGLSYWQSMRMIILPQALKIVIPGIVNTFIGLFKDTTLVSIIGLLDFLGMIVLSHSDPKWATPVQALTSYLFCALVFFIFCFSMGRYSIFMENRLNTGHR